MHVLPKEVIQMALKVLSLFAKQVRQEHLVDVVGS
jgi:hypothetical protein